MDQGNCKRNGKCPYSIIEKLDGVTPDKTRKGKIRPGYEHGNVHMIFDIKMDGNFTRKKILVADCHTTAPPSSITYSSVVFKERVRIAFPLAPLNDLDIFACSIGNANLNAKCREKLWTESGTEFGNEKGMTMIAERSIYGLNISGAALRAKLAETLKSFGYKYSESDADFRMKRHFRLNGDPYYKYMLCYVDDFIHIGFKPK